jgi:hypothetical protein
MRTRKGRGKKGKKKNVHFGTVTAYTGELHSGAEEAAAAVATGSKGVRVTIPNRGETEKEVCKATQKAAKATLKAVGKKIKMRGKVTKRDVRTASRARKKLDEAEDDKLYAEARQKVSHPNKRCTISGGRRRRKSRRRKSRRRKSRRRKSKRSRRARGY